MSLAREVKAAPGQLGSRLLAANSNYSLQSRRYSFDVPERNARGPVHTLVSYTVRMSREKGWRGRFIQTRFAPVPDITFILTFEPHGATSTPIGYILPMSARFSRFKKNRVEVHLRYLRHAWGLKNITESKLCHRKVSYNQSRTNRTFGPTYSEAPVKKRSPFISQ